MFLVRIKKNLKIPNFNAFLPRTSLLTFFHLGKRMWYWQPILHKLEIIWATDHPLNTEIKAFRLFRILILISEALLLSRPELKYEQNANE